MKKYFRFIRNGKYTIIPEEKIETIEESVYDVDSCEVNGMIVQISFSKLVSLLEENGIQIVDIRE